MSTKNTQLNPIKPNITQLKTIRPNSIKLNGCHIEVIKPCIYFHCPLNGYFSLPGLTLLCTASPKIREIGWVGLSQQ